MITIYCGSDTVKSREKYSDFRKKYQEQQDYSVIQVSTPDLAATLLRSGIDQALFTKKKIFFVQNALSKKAARDLMLPYEQSNNEHIVVWEEKMESRFIKTYFKKANIHVSDLPASIWRLLDGLKPGSKEKSIALLGDIMSETDENLTLYMIQRRIKELIMMYKGHSGGKKLADFIYSNADLYLLRKYLPYKNNILGGDLL